MNQETVSQKDVQVTVQQKVNARYLCLKKQTELTKVEKEELEILTSLQSQRESEWKKWLSNHIHEFSILCHDGNLDYSIAYRNTFDTKVNAVYQVFLLIFQKSDEFSLYRPRLSNFNPISFWYQNVSATIH
ncbi:MAG: hypothetical protein AAGB12_15915 [Pseudomonadota bacterium]